GYTGTVHFTSSDTQAGLPLDGTLANGAGSFSVTLKTSGSRTVTATDTGTTGIIGAAKIGRAACRARHYTLGSPGTSTAGTRFSLTVTALHAFNNTATGYTGTVHFTSSDTQPTLPSDGTLSSGTGSFSVTLKTSGSQTVTATDTGTTGIIGAA